MSRDPRTERQFALSGCSSVCDQGRKRCFTPEACEVTPYDVERLPWFKYLAVAAVLLGCFGPSIWRWL